MLNELPVAIIHFVRYLLAYMLVLLLIKSISMVPWCQ